MAYLHLRNNEVLQIFADATDEPILLPEPPINSSLVLANNNTLLAFYGTSFCSPIQVVKYSSSDNSWQNVTTLAEESPNYLAQSIYISFPESDLVYIYGGRNMTNSCSTSFIPDPSTIYDSRASYLVSNQIKVFNISDGSFTSITTASSPTAMFAAGVLRLSSSSSSLLVGGKAQNGWIGMNQLAIWEYSSWSFISTSNSAHVDSRTNPLVLPLKSPAGMSGSSSSNATLVLGGKVNSHISIPFIVGLNLNSTTGWTWNESLNQTLISSPESVLGAVTFENTLITITESTSRKRDTGYTLQYFDMSSWEQVSGFTPSKDPADTAAETTSSPTSQSSATPTETSTSSSIATSGKIALSTALPLSFVLVGAAVIGFVFYRRRKRSHEALLPAPRPLSLSPYFGSAATFEHDMLNGSSGESKRTQSINSWTEKRRIYDEQEKFEQQNPQYGQQYSQPYLAINNPDQLNGGGDLGIISVGEGVSDTYDNPFYTPHEENTPLHQETYKPVRSSTMRAASATLASYFKGRRTGSSATAPPTLIRSSSMMSGYMPYNNSSQKAPPLQEKADISDEDEEFFQGRDVQVLVSSKRRTRLRITNPDVDAPSRTNSEHSTIASLKVKKQRGKYAALTDQYTLPEDGKMTRQESIGSIGSPTTENDIVDARIGTRAASSGSSYSLR